MIPKVAFILAAGLGTRMGPEGEKVPKPLWQIYDKSILEILISQVKELGIEQVFVNSHHLHAMIEQYCAQRKIKINLLFESTLLGSGGCFLNLKKYVGNERILTLNGDSFFLLKRSEFEEEALSTKGHLLFARKLSQEFDYNRFEYEGNRLQEIIAPPHHHDFWTFAGVSIIDLSLVEGEVEPCSFFERIVIPGLPTSNISFRNSPFFDFGTLGDYCKGCSLVLTSPELNAFLLKAGVSLVQERKEQSEFSVKKENGKIKVKFAVCGQKVSVDATFSDLETSRSF